MKTNILTLCDFAKDYNGQLNIIGSFNQIKSSFFPSAPMSFYIVCQFVIKENIAGDHFVKISVANKESGEYMVTPQDFKLTVDKPEGENADKVFVTNLILNMDNTIFKAPGSFVLKVVSDNNVKELDFYVVKV